MLDRFSAVDELDSGRYGCQTPSELVHSVHAHLEALLNTRWRAESFEANLRELTRSLVQYGIPDFTATSVASRTGREAFGKAICEAIKMHEPRFISETVTVEILDVNDTGRSIEFRIEGSLHAKPHPYPVVFHSELSPSDQTIRVTPSDHV